MNKTNIVNTKLKKLTESQREEFFHDGGLCVEGLIDDKWISKLNNAISQFNDEAKTSKASICSSCHKAEC